MATIWDFVGSNETLCSVPPGGATLCRCGCAPEGFLCETAEKIKGLLWHSGGTSRQAVLELIRRKIEAVERIDFLWCPGTVAQVMIRLEGWKDEIAAR